MDARYQAMLDELRAAGHDVPSSELRDPLMSKLIDALRGQGHKIPRRRKERGLSARAISEIAQAAVEEMMPICREYAAQQVEEATAPLLERINRLEDELRKFRGVQL